MSEKDDTAGTLYVVATPIGNLSDVSARMRQTLEQVDLVAAEDTRTVGVFLSRLGIEARQTSLFEGNEVKKSQELVSQLEGGESVALVCEAGTPGISDPGAHLVAQAVEAGVRVTPIPGPCAATAALSASGLPTRRFFFEGFLPRAKGARRERLDALSSLSATLVFYESPRRLQKTLAEMVEVLGDHRRAVVAREITKLHEEMVRGTLGELLGHFDETPPRGEVTVLVEGAEEKREWSVEEMEEAVEVAVARGQDSPSQLAKRLAREGGWKRRQVYDLILERSRGGARTSR